MSPRPGQQSFLGTPATAPGPQGPDMLREFSLIRRDPLGFLDLAWRRHGDVVQFPIPRPPTYLVNDPAGVRRVLVDNARAYGKVTIQYRALSLVTGEGLLTTDGDAWRRQRRLVQPAFHHRTLETLVAHIDRAAQSVADDWRSLDDGTVVDVDAAMMQAALEIVGHALFGTDLSGDAAALAEATLDALDVVVARARVPITPPAWMPTPANRRLQRANAVLDASVARMMRERRAQGSRGADMLDLLIETTDDSGGRLTGQEIRNQMVTFIVAGHETVASALTWSWALLAAHPQAQERLQQEADKAVADGPLTFASLEQLPYARAVYDEALRLYPPAWLITRTALAADEIAGHAIPAGALIILSPSLLHRHPDLWEEPEAFRPERFLGSVDRGAFMPFGAGPRLCIGRDFSYVEGVLMLARLASGFTLRYPEGVGMPDPDPLVTIRPAQGLHLRVSRR